MNIFVHHGPKLLWALGAPQLCIVRDSLKLVAAVASEVPDRFVVRYIGATFLCYDVVHQPPATRETDLRSVSPVALVAHRFGEVLVQKADHRGCHLGLHVRHEHAFHFHESAYGTLVPSLGYLLASELRQPTVPADRPPELLQSGGVERGQIIVLPRRVHLVDSLDPDQLVRFPDLSLPVGEAHVAAGARGRLDFAAAARKALNFAAGEGDLVT